MSNTSVPEPVASFWKAVNEHDESGFLNAFTADGVVDDWGRVFTGPKEIKAWSDKEFIGARGTLDIESVHEEGGHVIVRGGWKSTHANGMSKFTFETSGDKLTKMTIREG
ncbi:nuclear transport factor 2 family protein [Glutamicibacter sp. PS]|uniref:nuclear transport factor 2 family protein n=1 Tax=Glutamicibacter sp. PS TaxID=3075634 RepID=UPI00284726F8|nr:nuclear transport factor 2 family protein [Glutamicibacter sp. PS]MDR4534538.1 nuclear transport factor 2 family protein [Glutamicibacter sp. PS]